MKTILDIIRSAKEYNACEIADAIGSSHEAITALLSPQGREFALNTGFPHIEDFRALQADLSKDSRVFLDAGAVSCRQYRAVAVGDTLLDFVAYKPTALYHVIAMHGAKVRIKASRYAVITVTNIGGSIEVINDGSAVVNVEEFRDNSTQIDLNRV